MVLTKSADVAKQGFCTILRRKLRLREGVLLSLIGRFVGGSWVGWGGCLFEAGRSLTFSAFSLDAYSRWALIQAQGPHSHILMTGGGGVGPGGFWWSKGFFWLWHFGQKGFFWVYERRRDFFGSRSQHRVFLISDDKWLVITVGW